MCLKKDLCVNKAVCVIEALGVALGEPPLRFDLEAISPPKRHQASIKPLLLRLC
jgi:hypothetical protein